MSENDSARQGRFFGPVTVPEGNVWVMGDNRANSKDSRFHLDDELQGTIPVSNIIGKVRFIVLPPVSMGRRPRRRSAAVAAAGDSQSSPLLDETEVGRRRRIPATYSCQNHATYS
ncbi:signal peptidase I [Rhodococcus sp. TAF43]|uniref:signal peptidase I n=1 Tax=Rhodococcus sp. TAF43 TaxID=3237483 RepID=UPI003F9A0EEA